jgi:hypothetical protein
MSKTSVLTDATAALLHQFLICDLETGELTWRVQAGKRKFAGQKATFINHWKDYPKVELKGRTFKAHRISHWFATGEWPEIIDHIDGDIKNFAPSNLRACTAAQSTWNRKLEPPKESGQVGVHWVPKKGLWEASLTCHGTKHNLGSFPTLREAIEARHAGELKYYGDFAPHLRG